jgi:hypothetical protein
MSINDVLGECMNTKCNQCCQRYMELSTRIGFCNFCGCSSFQHHRLLGIRSTSGAQIEWRPSTKSPTTLSSNLSSSTASTNNPPSAYDSSYSNRKLNSDENDEELASLYHTPRRSLPTALQKYGFFSTNTTFCRFIVVEPCSWSW